MRTVALGMADEGGGVAVFGGNLDLPVDHGVSFRCSVCRFLGVLGFAHRYDCKETGPWQGEGPFAKEHRRPCKTGLERRGPDRHCLTCQTFADPCRPLRSRPELPTLTQTRTRFFDEIGRLMNDAAGAAQGVKREVDAVVRNQAEKILRDLDIVKREEFEAVKDMARLAREENEALKARIAALEAKLGVSAPAPDSGSPKAGG